MRFCHCEALAVAVHLNIMDCFLTSLIAMTRVVVTNKFYGLFYGFRIKYGMTKLREVRL